MTSSALCAVKAWSSGSSPSAGAITGTIGSACLRANSKSRSSCAGTAMTAPGAVAHEDVVGDPDRDLLAGHRVRDRAPRVDSGLVLVLRPVLLGARGVVAHVVEHLGLALRARHERRDQRVLGRQDEERRAEERVGARGEDGDRLVQVALVEQHLGALGAADPVALHGEHALGPVLEQRHVVEQALRVVGDLEVPLRQDAALDRRSAALAVPVDDLLVGEHRLVDRAPVDGRLALVGQAALEQQQEDPLRPAVVLGLGGGELARPVDRPAHALHLLADRGDVVVRDVARVAALADRGVLGRQPERVVAHRVQHASARAGAADGRARRRSCSS